MSTYFKIKMSCKNAKYYGVVLEFVQPGFPSPRPELQNVKKALKEKGFEPDHFANIYEVLERR